MPKWSNKSKDLNTKRGDSSDKYLREPLAVYEQLYLVNKRLIQAADVLDQLRKRLKTPEKELLYVGRLIQETRASICDNVMESLHGIEMAEVTRRSKTREAEEKRLRDPADVYPQVRAREKERQRQGLPPRIKFVGE